MARCPIVRPETVRVTLADGEWLELAKELTAGEYRDMVSAQFKDSHAGERPVLDRRQLGISRILAYVKEWSFVDFKGEPLPITDDWLRKFDQSTFAEVVAAVEAHDDASEKAIEARKNDQAGGKNS
jgi:hypothetical protein